MIDVKDFEFQIGNVMNLLHKTAKGIPERIKAINDLKQHEAEMLTASMSKLEDIMKDANKQREELKDLMKSK